MGSLSRVESSKTYKWGVSFHLSSYELVGHAQNEVGPEDMQHLEHSHHGVKEVIAKEGRIELQRVHHGAVQDPGDGKGETVVNTERRG